VCGESKRGGAGTGTGEESGGLEAWFYNAQKQPNPRLAGLVGVEVVGRGNLN